MKKRIGLKSFAMMAIVSLLFMSCEDDGSDDVVIYANAYTVRATVTSEVGQTLTLKTDGGNQLMVVSDYATYTPETGQRTIATYSIENGSNGVYDVCLHSSVDILTKDVVSMNVENESQIGNNPIHLYNTWCANGYLNVNFGLYISGNITHSINLVNNTLVQNPDDGKVYLEFRHNTNGDGENYAKRGTVSFDLAPYKDENNYITFVIKSKEFNGVTTIREIQYNFIDDAIVDEQSIEFEEGIYE